MSRCLLQISVGPVQDFIAAARRTRDLWFGSYLLSEISKAAANAVMVAGGKLIFPYSDKLANDLKPDSDFNVANVILAEVEREKLAEASNAAKQAAEDRWREFIEGAYKDLKLYVDPDEWDYQKNGVIEFYSAWQPLGDSYKQTRQNVARLLAARKNLRDFTPWEGTAKVPKSSLDGLRESVLLRDRELKGAESGHKKENIPEPENSQGHLKKSPMNAIRRIFRLFKGDNNLHDPELSAISIQENISPETGGDTEKDISAGWVRIKKGESLDLVGCVKRAAGGQVGFPSVTRIAMDSWLRGCDKDNTRETETLLTELKGRAEDLATLRVLSRVIEADIFPYEGTALLPHRYDDFLENARTPANVETVTKEMEQIMAGLHRLHKPMEPYLAILCADGDKMGQAISLLDTSDKHREFSKTLSRFAGESREIVTKCHGCCVYTGGDDVLAFLPADTAIGCARALYDTFGKLWEDLQKNPDFKDFTELPTLSVGIAIGHALEDLEILLEFGRDAEKLAKSASFGKGDSRNGLAVTVRARNNSEIFVREQWRKDKEDMGSEFPLSSMSLDKRLLFWASCFAENRIPSKFPYELRDSAKLYEKWEDKKTIAPAMQTDVLRIFKRKDLRLGCDEEARVKDYIVKVIKESHKSIERLADELLVAQWIGAALEAAGEGIDDKSIAFQDKTA
jgi:CRISPR-associated protein Cmr2